MLALLKRTHILPIRVLVFQVFRQIVLLSICFLPTSYQNFVNIWQIFQIKFHLTACLPRRIVILWKVRIKSLIASKINIIDIADDQQSLFELINELVRFLKQTVENNSLTTKVGQNDTDKIELYQTIAKLKNRLAAKTLISFLLLEDKKLNLSEQASSYRTLLRTNKNSSEYALQCLREKYDSELHIKDEVS